MSQPSNRPYAPQPAAGRLHSEPGRQHAPQGRPQYRPEPGRQNMPPRQNAPRPVKTGRTLPYGLGKLVVISLIVAALGFGLQILWPDGFPVVRANNTGAAKVATITEIHSTGPLRINEIMTSNRNTLSIADGSSPDWVEIMNVSGGSVNLAGYQLAENASSALVFTFPEIWLEPDECILVYCDSRLRETAGEDLHAPFRLSSAGDTLMLFNAEDTAVDTINIPVLSRDRSYARLSASSWEESAEPTPGLANTAENYRSLTEPAADSPVIVNEVLASNGSILADENGQYYDYIELYNRSSETVNLEGWYLSDDSATVRKWRFPAVSIAPGEYLVVYASKLDRSDDPAYLHSNFSLSSEGEEVVLSNSLGRVMDSVQFGLSKSNVAFVRQDGGGWMQGTATPGRAN
ncbi:MAG: lamin tail domain-containing protein [Clostridia bacterium]|nr:lamin tail domain-containing protein [Clostridia bacterium]